MSDFGDFIDTAADTDPTADFLAREAEILGADAALFQGSEPLQPAEAPINIQPSLLESFTPQPPVSLSAVQQTNSAPSSLSKSPFQQPAPIKYDEPEPEPEPIT